jgi:DNA-binding NarL/FixJ family response regulator
MRTSPNEEPSWLAYAALIDADPLLPHDDLGHIIHVAKYTAVLVLDNEAATQGPAYLRAGTAGVIGKRESGERIVSAVRAVTAGANVIPCNGTTMPALERVDTSGYHLSGREEQVLRQISRGPYPWQIATWRGISPHTVTPTSSASEPSWESATRPN